MRRATLRTGRADLTAPALAWRPGPRRPAALARGRARGCALVLALGLGIAPSCGGAVSIPAVDLQVTVTGPDGPVAFGAGFELRVERIWSNGLEPAPWDDGLLAPLVVTTRRVETEGDGARRRETRWLHAHAFGRPQVAVEGLTFSATAADGTVRTAVAEDLVIAVDSALAGHGEGFEPPAALAPDPGGSGGGWALGLAAAAIFGAALWVVLRRRSQRAPTARPASTAPAPTPADPAADAIVALGRLDLDDPVAAHLQLDAVVRRYLEARFCWPALQRTTQEVLAPPAPEMLETRARDALAAALGRCDLVKFAADRPDRARTERTRELARTFVEATAAPAEAAP